MHMYINMHINIQKKIYKFKSYASIQNIDR